ncbi:hypothetical protein QUW15_00810 [Desulfovibrio piger]|nr:hypothetical protein [Desulfovibrio piger]
MPFPGIFRRLFGNEGAGPLLRKEIIPPHADTHGSAGSDPITPESIGAMAANAKPGSASSADLAVKLKTPRAIDGVNFDGSAAIIHYATCSTAAGTAAKVVSLAGFTLVTGAKVTVRFTVTNTAANPTLNVGGTGAKAIQYRNAAITAGALAANRTYEFVYDGSSWELVGDLDSNTTYTAASATPKAPGTAAVGTSPKYAREDHVHPAQTSVSGSSGSCTGNAATATKLAAARTILVNLGATAAASFDGSANATPGVSGTLPVARGGTGRTDGKAAALAAARTISLTGDATGSAKFDGSANAAIAATIIGLVPVGGIVAFSGTFSGRNPVDMKSKKAMTGWCLCDGTATNGLAVPDLRDRMIMGAGTTYKTGAKGGAASHTHSVSGTVGATTTTLAQTAAHGHATTAAGTAGGGPAYTLVDGGTGGGDGSVATTKVGGSASHTHSLTGAKSGSASSLPPYYALAFIMRCA